MVYGFQTDTCLHIFYPDGCDRWYKLPSRSGQSPVSAGRWSPLSHCVFVPRLPPGDLCGPGERFVLVYAGADGRLEQLPFSTTGEALPRPENCGYVAILRQDKQSGETTRHFPALQQPMLGCVPVETTHFTNDRRQQVTLYHIGQPITEIFKSQAELVRAIRMAGAPPLPTMREAIRPAIAVPRRDGALAEIAT